jgi:hypothetical protein
METGIFAARPSALVIARSEATKQSRAGPQIGLLCGACHRGGHFGPARNDKPFSRRGFLLPLPGGGEGWGEGVPNSKLKHPIPLTLAHYVRSTSPLRGEVKIKPRSRDASRRPSYATPLSEVVTTGLDPVVYADATRLCTGGSAVRAKLRHGLPA